MQRLRRILRSFLLFIVLVVCAVLFYILAIMGNMEPDAMELADMAKALPSVVRKA